MAKQAFTEEDDALLAELGVAVETKKTITYTPREERIIAGFEEIQKFVDEHERAPEHGEDNDIFERLYAVRLDQIRKQDDCKKLLKDMDYQKLLNEDGKPLEDIPEDMDDDELLAQLGVDTENDNSITSLKYVKPRAEIRAAEEIANRKHCEDFEKFKPIFLSVQKDLDNGIRETRPFKDDARVNQGDLFILSGQKVYVAEKGEQFVNDYERKDSKLRVIYDNGTESQDMLMRSLQRALNKDKTGRRITNPLAGPLFSDQASENDVESGTIYVLRSLSDHPTVKENRDLVHKIGVTGGSVEKRINNAKNDPTFLMDEVEVLATYKLANISRHKLEKMIHRFFSSAKLDVEIQDRFGKPVIPNEWYLVPLFVIDEMVEKIKDETIDKYIYEPAKAKIIKI